MRRLLVIVLGIAAFAGLGGLLQAGGASGASGVAAQRQVQCAGLGEAAGFSVFVRDDYVVSNTQLEGRLAVGGSASVQSWAVGVAGQPDDERLDLIVGGSLTASNAQVPNGSATHGGAFSGSLPTPNGTLSRADPPFSFDDEFDELHVLSDRLGAEDASGSVSGPDASGALLLRGEDPERNVFALPATLLESVGAVRFDVPPGSTTLVNVTGASFVSRLYSIEYWNGSAFQQLGDDPGDELEALRRATLWNFPQATSVQIGPGVAWQGSVLAPDAALSLPGGMQLYGQVMAESLEGSGTVRDRPFDGCLTPAPPIAADDDLALEALCVDPLTNRATMRLSNLGERPRVVTWEDRDSAQAGRFAIGPGRDVLFTIAGGDVPHRIVVNAGAADLAETTSTRRCEGVLRITKLAVGTGVPSGRWTLTVTGDNGFDRQLELGDGETATVRVPGQIGAGQVDPGQLPGGYRYTVVEEDPRGAESTTIDHVPVTVHDGEEAPVTVVNRYVARPEPPDPTDPTDPPVDPAPTPPPVEPVRPPGTPEPPPGLGLVVGTDPDAADLAIAERLTPRRIVRDGVVTATVRVRNLGPLAAQDVVAGELPQLDPANPNRIARILSVRSAGTGGPGGDGCTRRRPVRCSLGTLQPGAAVTIRARVRVRVAHALRSVVMVASPTPDPNTTNNFDAAGLVSAAPAPRLRAAVRAPAVARTGEHVRYRVRATAVGRVGADFVRICHRPPAGLLVTGSGPGTFRRGASICRDVRRIARGAAAGFAVRAVPAAGTAGRTLPLPATASAPDAARPARAATTIRIVGPVFGGRG